MIRSKHRLYDLREILLSSKVVVGLLLTGTTVILYISFQFIYIFILLFMAIFALRTIIGRRCPRCDAALKETDAERDKQNVFIMYIIWSCPRCDHTEKETIKGSSGLFGVG